MNDMEKNKKNKLTEEEKAAKAKERKEKLNVLLKKYKDRFQLRPLKDDDMYTVFALLKELLPEEGLRDAFAAVALGNKSIEQIGMRVMVDIVFTVMKTAGAVKDDLYAFLSDLSGITPDKLKEMPFGTTPAMLWALVNDAKNADFFEDVSTLF